MQDRSGVETWQGRCRPGEDALLDLSCQLKFLVGHVQRVLCIQTRLTLRQLNQAELVLPQLSLELATGVRLPLQLPHAPPDSAQPH